MLVDDLGGVRRRCAPRSTGCAQPSPCMGWRTPGQLRLAARTRCRRRRSGRSRCGRRTAPADSRTTSLPRPEATACGVIGRRRSMEPSAVKRAIDPPACGARSRPSRPARKDKSFMPSPLPASGRVIHGLLFARSSLHPARGGDRLGHHWRKRGHDMSDDLMRKWELSRRRVLGAARGSRPGRTVRGAFGQQARSVERAAQEQGRSPQLRRLDLRRHLHAHRQAVRDRLGRQGRFDDLLVQRPSDQARDHVRGRREDRRLAILALLLPQLRQPGPGRAARRPAGRRRLHQGLHALHQAGGDGRRQDHGPALLLRGVGLELLLATCWRS